jgi:hypothetical protein
MNVRFRIPNLIQAFNERLFPTLTRWNRLEGRPRAIDFDRSLKAEVRDALWMLTRQWQMGEFQGDDAGTPAFVKTHYAYARLEGYQPDGHPQVPFTDETPLEARVEARPIPFQAGSIPLSLDLRLLMGRRWLKLTTSRGMGGFNSQFITRYAVRSPDPTRVEDTPICSNPETWQQFAAAAGRLMDGWQLYAHRKAGGHAWDGLPIPVVQRDDFDDLVDEWITWFDHLFYQPTALPGGEAADAWRPEYLEYQFTLTAPQRGGEQRLTADEYYHGRLDWYNLDVDNSRAPAGLNEPPVGGNLPLNDGGAVRAAGAPDGAGAPEDVPPVREFTVSAMPVPVQFDGMPNTRWWAFEDGRASYANLKPDQTDLARLLVVEFGLVYANDWFIAPLILPAGSLAEVRGLAVTNVFGERTWVLPAGRGRDEDWQRWSMFTLSVKGTADVATDTRLLVLPTVPKIQESEPIEEATMVRDEMSNLVWGIETSVPMPDGRTRRGSEVAFQLRTYLQRLLDGDIEAGLVPRREVPPRAKIRYRVMNTTPENWIPFIPVRIEGDNRQIQLQRASMPRLLEGGPRPPAKIKPRTLLLRHGLDLADPQPYFLHEEEVPRAGVQVRQSYQRARWYGGQVFTWVGIRKITARGEASSNLAFDQIVDMPYDAI